MNIWKAIKEAVAGPIREEKQFNGNTGVRFKDLDKLMRGSEHSPGLAGPNRGPKPEGEALDCDYKFNPSIEGWNRFFPNLDKALKLAATDSVGAGSPDQHVGSAQGTHVLKKNWGGRVVGAAGKPRSDFERMPSAMDRYDVLMVADITTTEKIDKKTLKPTTVKTGILKRFVYAPSIGSYEERRARLEALLSGTAPTPLKRRPQPHVPEPDLSGEKSRELAGTSDKSLKGMAGHGTADGVTDPDWKPIPPKKKNAKGDDED